MKILNSSIVRYAVLPGFLPRIAGLFSGGFVHIAYLMAVIYQSLRLLPPGHPYLDPRNMGRYGVRHVIAEAANNLVFSKRNIDQIVVFSMVLIGLGLLILQFVLLIVALVAQQPAFAAAAASEFKGIFTLSPDPGPSQDLAFILMDRVFGTKNIFNSCVATGVPCLDLHGNALPGLGTYPFPFHTAMHSMLRFYSMGIFLVSVMVIIYYVITVVGETAVSGTPFGQRFNKAWVPVRLIVFFALLVPLNIGKDNAGLNGAQIITFWTVKAGSNFATNAWGVFNKNLKDTYLGKTEQLIASPNVPELGQLVQFMFVVKTCKLAEGLKHDKNIQAYVVRQEQPKPIVPGANARLLDAMSFDIAVLFNNYGNITIRFGEYDPKGEAFKNQNGNVYPWCGDLKVQINDVKTDLGSYRIQELYFELIKTMWRDEDMGQYAGCLVNRSNQSTQDPGCLFDADVTFARNQITKWQNEINTKIKPLIEQQVANGNWDISQQIKDKGWAGAGIWYNRLAEMNGQVATSLYSMPLPEKYPYLLEVVSKQRRMTNENSTQSQIFTPELAGGAAIDYPRNGDSEIYPAMARAFTFWETGRVFESSSSSSSDSPFISAINAVFGTSGIFDMLKNTDIHPLAQLSALGKSMMEAAIRNMGVGLVGGKVGAAMGDFVGTSLHAASAFMGTVGKTMMAMSFVLYYVLPLMPFIYFLFAVSGWIKSIFEAIVAMPLWALAHIRIDGEGLPGPGATNGYFLLLEIFLRPVLTVFGLLASVTIFASLVQVLNEIFSMVVLNATGYNMAENSDTDNLKDFMRGPVDRFFYTVIYVIICYLIGVSCFKLIDLIPAKILRWAGVSAESHSEGQEAAEKLLQKTYAGTQVISGSVKGGALAAL
jgi:conjugal transfer/type IV secretion protein DotA/TraY